MSESKPTMSELDQNALFYHENPKPGKLEIQATKPLGNQRDLALAYSPGVAAPCLEIKRNPSLSFNYTARGNLVGVVSNGTAVLGLGDIGALASKPVMEGKAVLFKKFAGIDVFDIEVDETDIDKFSDVVAALEPTFGGINLEDIKSPECFIIEDQLRERMNIPVFHDDQHGTAIIAAAAFTNGLHFANKDFSNVKVVTSGAGAAALACLNLLVTIGVKVENIWVTDRYGVAYKGREEEMNQWKDVYVKDTDARTLEDVIEGADVFMGLSAGGVLKPEMVKKMADKPLILALANPSPEIMPDEALAARPDAMICTGRSDFPNQVNNVLCFPFIFRGALDVGATTINEEMKMAATRAIAELAREAVDDASAKAIGGELPSFGPGYLIPSPFDQRLILRIAPAVAKAAMDSGVATRPITDFDAYNEKLNRFVFRSGLIMKPVIEQAKTELMRVIYSDGEDERVLRATQAVIEDKLAKPILIGRPAVINQRMERYGLKMKIGTDFDVINPEDDPRYRDYVDLMHELAGRKGITPAAAKNLVRTNTSVIGALAVKRNDADALICGLEGRFSRHLRVFHWVLGLENDVSDFSALSLLLNQQGAFFFTDTYVTEDPSAEEIAEMTIKASAEIERFGLQPRAALLSFSNFGSRETKSSQKMTRALEILGEKAPDLIVDGPIHADAALSPFQRNRIVENSPLGDQPANLFVFPDLNSANITMNMVKSMTDALHVGPIMLGAKETAHIITPSVTSRGIVNMTAIAAVEAQERKAKS
ncbi:MAG: NADP-dependent malic enzyme [Hyphomicrobiales bacterium]